MAASKKPRLNPLETPDKVKPVSKRGQKKTDKLADIFCKLDVTDNGQASRDESDQPSAPVIPTQSLTRKSDVSVPRRSSSSRCCQNRRINYSLDPDFKLTDAALLDKLPPRGSSRVHRFVVRNVPSITDISVELITRRFPKLKFLDLAGCSGLTDTALLYIAVRLRRLKHLNLSRLCLISPRGIGYLAGHVDRLDTDARNLLRQLKGSVGHADNVDLSSADDDQDLTRLPLDNLIIGGCNLLTNEALWHLSSIKELRNLDLSSNDKINAVGIGHLITLPKLVRLYFKSCLQVGNDVMAQLAQMSELLALNLSDCPRITFDGLKTLLHRLPRITCLDISGCTGLKSNSLDQIVDGMQELRRLRLDYSHTTKASLDSVGLELPLLIDLMIRGQNGDWRSHSFSSKIAPDNRSGQRKRSAKQI